MIAWTIYLTFIGAVAALLFPRKFARWIALATTGVGLAIALLAFCANAGAQTVVNLPWIPTLGMRFHLAVDGISLTLVLVTGHHRI